MTVLGLQFNITWENKPANFATVRRLLAQRPPERGALLVLPEMFATGFSMNVAATAEDYGGATEQFLAGVARELGIFIAAGAAMRGRDGRARNKLLVFGPDGRLLAYYAKMRPFTPGGEGQHFVRGERPVLFPWGGGTVAPFICYDLRFPELFRAIAARQRPELYLVAANWPDKRIHHWLRLLQARAIENQAYVLGVNRIGNDPYYHYPGRSVFIDPQGEILADAGAAEGFVGGQLDLDSLRRYREGLPFLADLKVAESAAGEPATD